MRRYFACIAIFVLLFAICVPGCGETEVTVVEQTPETSAVETAGPPVGYRQIMQTEAHEIMQSDEDYIILDVRTQSEFDEVHIPGAICIPNEEIGTDEIPELPDKDQMILVYCRSGRRSKLAAEKLVALGYTNVLEFGGIIDWIWEKEP
ncbi:Rhodanese-related sulfurtransferase [Ruminococcaceae bacterium YRB3002]|nr:Rhodanese-related sulfurtransferase [Ruminococcaceae bacterium YRB3002]